MSDPEAMAPLLTLVLIGYNMPRELPRTVQSLSASMQRGIAEQEYEILLIDNGSTAPFDAELCRRLAGNLRVIRIDEASPSPVRAINLGLEQARGRLVGVCIDGARMASPGLLRAAIAASSTHPKAVVGTLAFHLGPDLQNRSMAAGYDQAAEDRLLESVSWQADAYRLFDISVFANSSRDGWFVVPAESNAVFMRREQWAELGGYDERFTSPGGGLANLDLWARACAASASRVVLLLGEATFHQVHAGVSTNSVESKWKHFHDEYVRIHGQPYVRPHVPVDHFGSLAHLVPASLLDSLTRLQQYRETHEPRS